jgi:hypothetical protein
MNISIIHYKANVDPIRVRLSPADFPIGKSEQIGPIGPKDKWLERQEWRERKLFTACYLLITHECELIELAFYHNTVYEIMDNSASTDFQPSQETRPFEDADL